MNSLPLQEDWLIPMPLTQASLEVAHNFAREQPTPAKAEQVYFNTLAVCAVHNYLQILGISTNLAAGDSWNRAVRFGADVADLWLTFGVRLECRSTKPGDSVCVVPPEAQLERAGYLVAEIDAQNREAVLLGFSPDVQGNELVINQLRSLQELSAYLEQFRPLVRLNLWLEDIFDSAWQNWSTVFPPQQLPPAWAFRGQQSDRIRRCKLLRYGDREVVLVVTLTPESDHTSNIIVELQPPPEQTYLPNHLQLFLLDEQEQVVVEAQARTENEQIKLEFSCDWGDCFSIKIVWGEFSVVEEFVL